MINKLYRCFLSLLMLLLLVVMTVMTAGCGEAEPPDGGEQLTELNESEMTEAYREILDGTYALLVAEADDDSDYPDGLTGIDEFVHTLATEMSTADRLESVGYRFEDLSGDGTAELLIMERLTEDSGDAAGEADDADTAVGSRLFAVYTLADGKPQCSLESLHRNSYELTAEGSFFNTASSGAMYSIFGEEKLTEDGTSLECVEYLFTYEKDESFSEIGYYRNNSGDWDKELSEEISEDEYYRAVDEMESRVKTAELKTFAEYVPSATYSQSTEPSPAKAEPATLKAEWASDADKEYDSFDEYIDEAATEENGAEPIFISSDKEISNFKILELSLAEVDDEGNIKFSTRTLYKQKELTADCPLKLTVPFYGTIPGYGLSYTDADGSEKISSINISGEDGSIQLSPIDTL